MAPEHKQNKESEPSIGGWRLKSGVGLFALSLVLPLAGVPLVAAMDLSAVTATTLSGALLAAGELSGIVAVAVMGKSGYHFMKTKAFVLLKRYGPPREVGPLRYRIGLILFLVPLLTGWITPYLSHVLFDGETLPLPIAVGGDILLLSSFIVLGGEFWEKIRALFIRRTFVCKKNEVSGEPD